MRLANLISVVLLSACNRFGANPSEMPARDLATKELAACTGALSSYCNGACKSYDAKVADLRAEAASHPLFCFEQIGTCGNDRFAEFSLAGFDDTVLYYDAAGNLLGAHVSSDTNEYCGGSSFTIDYGTIPSCAQTVTETLCHCGQPGNDGGC